MDPIAVVDVDELSSFEIRPFDAFLCSASYERRCMSVPLGLNRAGVTIRKSVIVFNGNYEDAISENLVALRSIEANSSDCRIDTDDPILTSVCLYNEINGIYNRTRTPRRIGIDITTFTRESLLILLCCLWRVLEATDEVTLFYCRARQYDLAHEGGAKWLSRGIREVRSVIGFPGNLRPSRRSHLIVMAGFEDDRAVRLVAELEPTLVSVGIPDVTDGHAAEHNEVAEAKMRSISRVVGNAREFVFNAYDPFLCLETLRGEVMQVDGMNTILAPMNTKISTVGAGLVGRSMPDVQLCYAQAELYNLEAYSEPGNEVYVFRLPVDKVLAVGRA